MKKKVRCVEGAPSSFLNKGEVYKVIQEEGELFYTLENSKGVIRDGWLKNRFVDVIEEQEEKLYVAEYEKSNIDGKLYAVATKEIILKHLHKEDIDISKVKIYEVGNQVKLNIVAESIE